MHLHLSGLSLAALALWQGLAPAPAPAAAPPDEQLVSIEVTLEGAPAPDEVFAAPDADLRLAADAVGEMTLHDLLVEFASMTGEQIHATPQTTTWLKETPVGLLGPVTVPAEEVYAFVENLLYENRYVVSDLRREEPRLLGVYPVQNTSEAQYISGWRAVDEDDLDAYADHPALLVQTTIDVAPLDARQVTTSLRPLFRNQYYQMVLNVGDGQSLLVRGTGRDVASFAELVADAVADATD